MRVAFLTEMGFVGKVSATHPNMRTEFAWMHALSADHYNIHDYKVVTGYDIIMLIFPKGKLFLSAEGSKIVEELNPVSGLLSADIVGTLKANNKRVCYVQEGPHWWYNDYELVDQINFYNMLSSCDIIFTHNESDTEYYKGLFPTTAIHVLPTLLIDDSIHSLQINTDDKVIIGGNFARWYGGFESYIVAQEFKLPIWGQISHATRFGEEQLLQHLPRVNWVDWMKQLSTFKYAVHLMPTVAAGTFSLNCAYFGIPCIGNINVDTQRLCHPHLSVDVHNVSKARELAKKLLHDNEFYTQCVNEAINNYKLHYSLDVWKQKMKTIFNTNIYGKIS